MAQFENEWLLLFFGAGLLGGFTTYSTFAYEIMDRSQTATGKKDALLYNILTLTSCMMAAGAGYSIFR
jgi:fluoride ion exporter CrcB/FEX